MDSGCWIEAGHIIDAGAMEDSTSGV